MLVSVNNIILSTTSMRSNSSPTGFTILSPIDSTRVAGV